MRGLAILLLLSAAAAAGPKVALPADCVIVHHVDFDALRKTEVWGRVAGPIREFLGDVMGFEGLFEQTGFDPGKDLDALTLALGGDLATDEERTYAIARGTFDAEKFAKCMKESGLTETTREGVTVYEDPGSEGKIYCAFHGAFALVDGTVLFSDPAKGMDALLAARKEGAEETGIAKALKAAPDAHAWTVLLPTPALRKAFQEEAKEDPQMMPLAALKSASVQYRLGDAIEIGGTAEAESPDLAKQVVVVAQAGLMGMGLAKPAKFDCKGATITASLSIPLEDAMTMMGMPVESTEKPGTSAQPVVTEGAPKIEGKGKLQRLALPGQVNALVASPDGKYVFVDRALESDVVLDAELHIVGKAEQTWHRMAFTLDGKTGVWPDQPGGKGEVRAIPGLKVLHEIAAKPGRFDEPWAVCALPDGKSFVVAGWKEVRLLQLEPLGWGEAGKPALQHSIAGAVDPKSALLVLIGDDNAFEVFDPGSLKSVATLTLPEKVTFDVVATGGRAWVGTKAGVILPVDIAGQRVLDPVRVADGGDVSLALSGRTLLAASQRFVDRDHHPSRLVAYDIDGNTLRPVAATEFVAPCPFNDVALLEGARTAILGGVESFVWTYGAE